MTLQEAVAVRTERALDEFIAVADRIPEEKLEWHPLANARTVLDIVQECGRVSERWSEVLETGEWIAWSEETIKAKRDACPDFTSSLSYLKASVARFVKAVRAMPDDRLDVPFASPWRTATMAEWLMHNLWHLSYHEGQLNYIQTLYDDWSYG